MRKPRTPIMIDQATGATAEAEPLADLKLLQMRAIKRQIPVAA